MSVASLFDIRLAEEIKIADRLSLVTIVVPIDVAQKQEKLRAARLVSGDMEDLESDVALLTNYLIQKSFTSTVRTLVQSVQIAERLKRVGRSEQREHLIAGVNDFLRNLYSVRVIGPSGDIVEDSGDKVVSLFAEVCQHIFSPEGGLAEERLPAFLASKQKEYVRLVLDRGRRVTSTIEAIGANQASNDKLELLLNRMETANLDWLIETYSLHLDATAGKQKLPELDNGTQRAISNAVLVRMRDKVSEFNESTKAASPKTAKGSIVRWLFGNKKQTVDLSQTNLLETEQFIVELRLHVSYRQQITILSSVLDKVNEFSSFLGAFEAVIAAESRKGQARDARTEIGRKEELIDNLKKSRDPVDQALGELYNSAQSPRRAEADLQEQLAKLDEELAKSIVALRDFFNARTQTANRVLAKLTDMGNKVRIMAPMVIQEARQKDAQFTAKLIEIFAAGTKEIQEIEGSSPINSLSAPPS